MNRLNLQPQSDVKTAMEQSMAVFLTAVFMCNQCELGSLSAATMSARLSSGANCRMKS